MHNDPHNRHRGGCILSVFLGVVLPKEKITLVLDSLPQEFVKPTAIRRVEKMLSFLQKIGRSVLKDRWSFYANKPDAIPQQVKQLDGGVFTCLYARCLATRCPMLTQSHIPAYRKLMIKELHQKKLSTFPPMSVQQGEYYAVDYSM